ncbi:MAG: hypothetical protein WEC75_01910 [Dehalococcoidia bacterium]
MFAVALTIVVFISTAMLLYQFWTGSLAEDDATASATPGTLDPAQAHPAPAFRADTAA